MSSYKSIGLIVMFWVSSLHAQIALDAFPEKYLPYSISENETESIDTTTLKEVSAEIYEYIESQAKTEKGKWYAVGKISKADVQVLLCMLQLEDESRWVYALSLTTDGRLKSCELIAASQWKKHGSRMVYCTINNEGIIVRTNKTNWYGKMRIKSQKYGITEGGEIVGL